jgi:uncharacterized membrane protein YbhN (UPF0104 family)
MQPSPDSPPEQGASADDLTPRSKRPLLWLVTLVTVGGVVWYLWTQWDRLHPLIQVPIDQVLVVGVLFAVGILLNALEFWVLYRRLGAKIGVVENWLLYGAGQLLNHAPGQVGTVYRFGYLKAVHHLSYSRSASGYGANLLLTVLSTGVLGLVATLVMGGSHGVWSWVLIAIFSGLVVVALTALLIDLPSTTRQGRLARIWRGFHEGWSEITSHSRTALTVILIELVKYLILAVRIQLSLSWVGVSEPYAFFLVIAAATGVVTFVALTPAAIGLREIAIGFAAAALGVQFDVALLGATLDRAVMLVWVVLIGGAGLIYTARKMTGARLLEVIRPFDS